MNRLKKLPDPEVSTAAYFTKDVRDALHGEHVTAPLYTRDINTLIQEMIFQLSRLNYDTSTLKSVEIAVIDNDYLDWLKRHHKKYSPRSVRKYWASLSFEKRGELWRKHRLNQTYNQYFIPIVIEGMEPGKIYNRTISSDICSFIQQIICENMGYPREYVHIMPQLFTVDEIQNEGEYIDTAVKELEKGGMAKKRKMDEIEGKSPLILFIPVGIKYHSFSYTNNLKKYREETLNPNSFSFDEQKKFREARLMIVDKMQPENTVVSLIDVATDSQVPLNVVEAVDFYYSYNSVLEVANL